MASVKETPMGNTSSRSERYNAQNGHSVVCAGCGKVISDPGPRQRHCDARCRVLAYKKAKRKLIIERHLKHLAETLHLMRLEPFSARDLLSADDPTSIAFIFNDPF